MNTRTQIIGGGFSFLAFAGMAASQTFRADGVPREQRPSFSGAIVRPADLKPEPFLYRPYATNVMSGSKSGPMVQGSVMSMVEAQPPAISRTAALHAPLVPTSKAAEQALAEVTNDDVRWRTDFAGPSATLSDRAVRVLSYGPALRPHLIDALERESQYVVAHVMMTTLQGSRFPTTMTTWNGLTVVAGPEGKIVAGPGQQPEIRALWQRKLRQMRAIGRGVGNGLEPTGR
jgi:hypothetical protein